MSQDFQPSPDHSPSMEPAPIQGREQHAAEPQPTLAPEPQQQQQQQPINLNLEAAMAPQVSQTMPAHWGNNQWGNNMNNNFNNNFKGGGKGYGYGRSRSGDRYSGGRWKGGKGKGRGKGKGKGFMDMHQNFNPFGGGKGGKPINNFFAPAGSATYTPGMGGMGAMNNMNMNMGMQQQQAPYNMNNHVVNDTRNSSSPGKTGLNPDAADFVPGQMASSSFTHPGGMGNDMMQQQQNFPMQMQQMQPMMQMQQQPMPMQMQAQGPPPVNAAAPADGAATAAPAADTEPYNHTNDFDGGFRDKLDGDVPGPWYSGRSDAKALNEQQYYAEKAKKIQQTGGIPNAQLNPIPEGSPQHTSVQVSPEASPGEHVSSHPSISPEGSGVPQQQDLTPPLNAQPVPVVNQPQNAGPSPMVSPLQNSVNLQSGLGLPQVPVPQQFGGAPMQQMMNNGPQPMPGPMQQPMMGGGPMNMPYNPQANMFMNGPNNMQMQPMMGGPNMMPMQGAPMQMGGGVQMVPVQFRPPNMPMNMQPHMNNMQNMHMNMLPQAHQNNFRNPQAGPRMNNNNNAMFRGNMQGNSSPGRHDKRLQRMPIRDVSRSSKNSSIWSFRGVVKSFAPNSNSGSPSKSDGYGFLTSADVVGYKSDIFFKRNALPANTDLSTVTPGKKFDFELILNSMGNPQAKNLREADPNSPPPINDGGALPEAYSKESLSALISASDLLIMESNRCYDRYNENDVKAVLAEHFGPQPLFDDTLPTKSYKDWNSQHDMSPMQHGVWPGQFQQQMQMPIQNQDLGRQVAPPPGPTSKTPDVPNFAVPVPTQADYDAQQQQIQQEAPGQVDEEDAEAQA